MDDAGGEKTEQPTPERLRKLRREGNVPRSQDVVAAASFLGLFVLLAALSGRMGEELHELVGVSIAAAFSREELPVVLPRLTLAALRALVWVSGPVLAGAVVIGVATNVAQVGFLVSARPLVPDLGRLDPVRGFKNLLSGRKLAQLVKTVIEFAAIGWLSWVALRDSLRDVAYTVRADLPVAVQVVGRILWGLAIRIAGAFLVVAAADWLYQRRRYLKDHMMSKHDVKQEYRQSEGDPQHKAERRRLHQEILSARDLEAVKEADVVIRNPDHLAIALAYDEEKGSAPRVVAKGRLLGARKILEVARHHAVPMVRDVPLAHALYPLAVGDEIPEELYQAVAEVLTFVMTLAREQERKATRRPAAPSPAGAARPGGRRA